MSGEVTAITIAADGTETHESWLLIRANTVSSGGSRLFDSELDHRRYVMVEITRCERRRDLKRDWLHSKKLLLGMSMSMAQWGAFVSSFGDGSGVPATLTWLGDEGPIPSAPFESRLAESHAEVRGAADEALAEIRADFEALETAFEGGAGKRILRERIRDLHYKIQNGPASMAFAAESLTEHTENVVAKARSDIEAMVVDAQARGDRLDSGSVPALGVGPGETP